MEKAGRPKTKIDWEKVDQLLIAGCTGIEAAANLGIHADTLYGHCEADNKVCFSAYLHEKRSKGDTFLRAAQYDEAVRKRNITMLIWLGKNRLKQSDKEEISHAGAINVINYSEKPIKTWDEKEKENDKQSKKKVNNE